MTTRKLYSEELVQLSESLEEMGNLVEASLKNLFFSIENKDMQLAERIVADDRNVNNLERSIEAQCLMLITTQQPIAQDLRTVSSILKVVTDIERIGDHASDIAELIQQMDHKQLERYSGHLQPMIAASREMVHEAVSAFVAQIIPAWTLFRTRKLYSEELVQLSESLEEMGNLVEASLKNLFFAIENRDMQLAERIVADDRNVNNLERSIEAQCLMLITTQQPIAQDLRTVSSILKVVTDIERIGDHASDIAELIQQMDHKQLERYSGHLQPMIAASREMVHEAVSAFVAQDQKKANDVIASDDIIDKLFDKVKDDIVIHIKEDRSDAIESLDALMLAKYLERIGDHAVNICEWEIFRETGTIQNTKVF